jgi:hypothetical protein
MTCLNVYDPRAILDAIDDHTVPILVGFGLAMVLQNIGMITTVVITRREGWISIPLPCTFTATGYSSCSGSACSGR